MFSKVLEQTITFLCSFFCEKQENLLDFFRRCFLALVFFLSGNFFVKATLGIEQKKNCWMVTVTFFFVSCPAKHLFDIQRFHQDSWGLTSLVDEYCSMAICFLFFSCLGKLVWKKLVTNNNHTKFFDTKTISFWFKINKKNFPHRQKMERSGFKWFPHLSRYVAPFREVLKNLVHNIHFFIDTNFMRGEERCRGRFLFPNMYSRNSITFFVPPLFSFFGGGGREQIKSFEQSEAEGRTELGIGLAKKKGTTTTSTTNFVPGQTIHFLVKVFAFPFLF